MNRINRKIRAYVRVFFITLPFLIWLGSLFFYCDAPKPRTVVVLMLALFGLGIMAIGVLVYEIIKDSSKDDDEQDQ